ncbi:MAG: aminopeptidase P family protein [Saprospiraceae bacterium]
MTIQTRLHALRQEMIQKKIDAYIIPSADPHQSEYVASHWQSRQWITGFAGSAGTAVVFLDEAGLWTDSRYFLQAEQELENSGVTLHKMVNQFEPEYLHYIIKTLIPGKVVAIDGEVWSQNAFRQMEKSCQQSGLSFLGNLDLIDEIWEDRPSLSQDKIIVHDAVLTGKSLGEKLEQLRKSMANLQVDYHLLTALDDIAWTFNIRGNDVKYNPVIISFALIDQSSAHLFISDSKLDDLLREYFSLNGVELHAYGDIFSHVGNLPTESKILVDPTLCSATLYQKISAQIIEGSSLPKVAKAIKNEVEIKNIRIAMEKDGAALANTFYWFENTLGKEKISEYDILEKLAFYRAQQKHYFGESFGAIVGYKGNGAIIHYAPPKENSATINPEGILLVDSGGQYLDGTTDITRTFTLDKPTEEAKNHYTLILKGLIALSKIKFPKGTPGGQLDTLARQFLWEHGLNYLHGTGHGVGYFLNVHEPPQGFATIQSERGRTVIEEGMLTSNEPGHYIPNVYGMRLENLVVCIQAEEEGFLAFETVTLYPFDLGLVEQKLLTPAEINWLNDYHEQVLERVSPLLEDEVKSWFVDKCKKLMWNH